MKTLIAACCVLLNIGVLLHAQTNVLSAVMANSSGIVVRPTNFTGFDLSSVFGRAQMGFNFSGAQTASTNATVSIEPNWMQISSPGTNASATGQVMLMRYLLSSENTGAGLNFGARGYTVYLDVSFNLQSTSNIARFVIGNSFNDAGPLTNNGVGVELTTQSGTNRVRLIAHNGSTNIASAWTNIPSTRHVLQIETRTNGVLFLKGSPINQNVKTASQMATLSNGPTSALSTIASILNAGLVVMETNSASREVSIYGAGIEISQ